MDVTNFLIAYRRSCILQFSDDESARTRWASVVLRVAEVDSLLASVNVIADHGWITSTQTGKRVIEAHFLFRAGRLNDGLQVLLGPSSNRLVSIETEQAYLGDIMAFQLSGDWLIDKIQMKYLKNLSDPELKLLDVYVEDTGTTLTELSESSKRLVKNFMTKLVSKEGVIRDNVLRGFLSEVDYKNDVDLVLLSLRATLKRFGCYILRGTNACQMSDYTCPQSRSGACYGTVPVLNLRLFVMHCLALNDVGDSSYVELLNEITGAYVTWDNFEQVLENTAHHRRLYDIIPLRYLQGYECERNAHVLTGPYVACDEMAGFDTIDFNSTEHLLVSSSFTKVKKSTLLMTLTDFEVVHSVQLEDSKEEGPEKKPIEGGTWLWMFLVLFVILILIGIVYGAFLFQKKTEPNQNR